MVAFTLAAGCGDPTASDPVEVAQSALFMPGTVVKWPNGVMPVCFDPSVKTRPNYRSELNQIRNKANAYWPALSKVYFQGWTECPTTAPNTVRLKINDSTAGNSGLGQGTYDMNIGVGGGANDAFANGLVAHEFGHALGYAHENVRPGWTEPANCAGPDENGNSLGTAADPQGVMGCNVGATEWDTRSAWDAYGSKVAYGRRMSGISPLVSSWHTGRQDHATVAADASATRVDFEGYTAAYGDGWIFNVQVPSSVPLKLYYSSARGDYWSTGTTASENAAKAAGYTLIRTEGYVYPTQQPGTVALKGFWHSTRQDNLTTTTAAGEQAALNAGYRFVRNEGFVFRTRPYNLLWQYWHDGRQDNLTTQQNSDLANTADNALFYQFNGFDGTTLRFQLPGTAMLKTYFGAAGSDYFSTATVAGQQSAINSGYVFVRDEGYVFTSSVSGLSPLKSFWSGSRGDNFTTVNRSWSALASGYTETRVEGYVFNIIE